MGRVESWPSGGGSISSSPSSNRTFSLFPFGQASPPSTAFRSSSSSGFHSLNPWSSCRDLEKSQGCIKVLVRVSFIASALLRMLPSQVYTHSLIQKPFERRQVAATVPIVKVTCPSPNYFIELLDEHLFGPMKSTPASQSLYLRFDLGQGFLRRSD